MKRKALIQLPLTFRVSRRNRVELFRSLSRILSDNSDLADGIRSTLSSQPGASVESQITAEQVLRISILRAIEGFNYDDLSFNLSENLAYMKFCLVGISDTIPQGSELADLIERVPAEVWEDISARLMLHIKEECFCRK